ncbi:UPF0145 protein [Sphingobium jiangsuense]|uniref:UPF0145 protein GGR43_004223 n=2 Tax=Sphingobium jiangsuense TaxID=870476 RepID=A0A7W6BV75_9SPHN|nr:uncharacterized protein YbjQ (UPF0145 family) [Sphingobium jiangsuense]GLT01079.1 UPF0145 protein [Sphingobium jiangsuense]
MAQSPWGSSDSNGSGGGGEMIVTTTPGVEGRPARRYHGIVTGEVIVGANVFRDLFAGIRDLVGGRAGAYEDVLQRAREQALGEMRMRAVELGANAVIGVDLDYEVLGSNGSMLMVSATGTAVTL